MALHTGKPNNHEESANFNQIDHALMAGQQVGQQGLAWLKGEFPAIVTLYNTELGTIQTQYFRKLSSEQRRQVAVRNLEAIIWRLEGGNYDADRFKEAVVTSMGFGLLLEDLTAGADKLMEIIIAKAQHDLSYDPHVCATLIRKVTYITNLFKATMATAFVHYETQRILSDPLLEAFGSTDEHHHV